MATPVLRYNSSSGSNTGASGAGPTTAVSGLAASGTGATNTITFGEPVDLSEGSGDGSNTIWVDTPSGERHIYQIVAIVGDPGSCSEVTTNEAIGATFADVAFAIGGTRQHPEADTTRTDAQDMAADWVLEFASGTYTFTVTVAPGNASGTRVTLRAASGAPTRPILKVPAASTHTLLSFPAATQQVLAIVEGLELDSSAGTGRTVSPAAANHNFRFYDCEFKSAAECYYSILATLQEAFFDHCLFTAGTTGIYSVVNTEQRIVATNCRFVGLTAQGIGVGNSTSQGLFVSDCVFDGCGVGVFVSGDKSQTLARIQNNTIYGSASHGIHIGFATGHNAAIHSIINNVIYGNGGYGIKAEDTTYSGYSYTGGLNALGANTSGNYQYVTGHASDISLSVDPFVDADGGNFSLNSVAGGGALVDHEGAGLAS